MLERIDKGASKNFHWNKSIGNQDYFELDEKGNRVVVHYQQLRKRNFGE